MTQPTEPTILPVTASDAAAMSADPVAGNIAALRSLFPDAFAEGRIDFDVLRQLLGDAVDDGDERYGLNWNGKRASRRLALTPSLGTLLPAPADSVEWDTTRNLMIEGDNLEVLKLLGKSYAGKVKLIYIDPPYNTGNDFVYPDDFKDNIGNYLRRTGQIDSEGIKNSTNAESSGRYHSDWLNMMYARLMRARALLSEDGVVFISIDEHEIANLYTMCSSIFGEENYIGIACRVAKKSNNKGDHWAPNFDYVVTCAKNKENCPPFSGGINTAAKNLVDETGPRAGEMYQLVRLYMSTIENRNPDQRFWIDCPDGSKVIPPGTTFPPERPNLGDGIWRWSKKKFDEERDRIVVKHVRSSNLVADHGGPAQYNVFTKTYLNDVIANSSSKPNNLIEGFINQLGSHEMTDLGIPFDYPKPSKLISYLCEIAGTHTGEPIVLDFFAGSGTTGHAVMAQNVADGGKRRFIVVQLPEQLDPDNAKQKAAADFCDALEKPRTISELTKERLRRAAAKVKAEHPDTKADLGFRAYKLANSNIRAWNPGTDLATDLLNATDNLLPGRSEADLLVELLLKNGIDLTEPAVPRTLAGKTVNAFGNGALVVCLADIAESEAEALGDALADWIAELAPVTQSKFWFKDKGFGSNQAKLNLAAILEQRLGTKNIELRSL